MSDEGFINGEVIDDPDPNSAVVGVDILSGAGNDGNPLRIVSPADGTTTDPSFAVIAAGAEPGADVDLWTAYSAQPDGITVETVTAGADGRALFAGGNDAAAGTSQWWVVSGAETSERVTVDVVAAETTEPESEPGLEPEPDVEPVE